jgi:hypothetical protein
MNFSVKDLEHVAESNNLSLRSFKKNYVVAHQKSSGICIFQASYLNTHPARASEDGKLRDIKSDLSWLTVGEEHILPIPGVRKYPPLPLNVIYTETVHS